MMKILCYCLHSYKQHFRNSFPKWIKTQMGKGGDLQEAFRKILCYFFFILKTSPRNIILQSSIFNIFPPCNDHLIFPIEGRCLKTNLWRCASKTKTSSTSSPRAAKQLLTRAAKQLSPRAAKQILTRAAKC